LYPGRDSASLNQTRPYGRGTCAGHTPYGATESLPSCSISGSEILEETEAKTRKGAGTCVGLPLPSIKVKVIEISDKVISTWNKVRELPQGIIGEIVVQGPIVTHEYYNLKKITQLHKIYEGIKIWHRIGTSRGTMFTIPCEAIFNQHPQVFRSALVGIGQQNPKQPAIIVEPKKGKMPRGKKETQKFSAELREIGKTSPLTQAIDTFLFHPSFPVDIRHNAKIFREKLALWAKKKVTRN